MPPFPFQRWAIQYGLIIQGTNLSLRDSIVMRAHLEGLSSDDVSVKFNAFYYVLYMLFMFASNLMHCYRSTGTHGPVFILLRLLTWSYFCCHL